MTKQKNITHIKELTFDSNNARQHNERNIGMIAEGLQEVGAGRSILIDGNGEIIAGNGVVEAAAQAGITKVKVVEANGDEIIAVMRRDLKGKKKLRAALLDNRTQETSGWNVDVIKNIATDDNELLRGLWSQEEISALTSLPSVLLDDDEEEDEQENVTDDDMQRMTLWVPRDSYDAFLADLRTLSGRINEDDIAQAIMFAVRKCVSTGD